MSALSQSQDRELTILENVEYLQQALYTVHFTAQKKLFKSATALVSRAKKDQFVFFGPFSVHPIILPTKKTNYRVGPSLIHGTQRKGICYKTALHSLEGG